MKGGCAKKCQQDYKDRNKILKQEYLDKIEESKIIRDDCLKGCEEDEKKK